MNVTVKKAFKGGHINLQLYNNLSNAASLQSIQLISNLPTDLLWLWITLLLLAVAAFIASSVGAYIFYRRWMHKRRQQEQRYSMLMEF
jgi:hypothetical protein